MEILEQGAKVRVLKKVPVEYWLIDKYYKSDVSYTKGESIKGGRKTKEFFDKFCKEIFKKNLIMYKNSGYFPLIYNERNTYSSIGATLDSMGYTHMSEYGIEIGRRKPKGIDKKFRSVDFWCTDNLNEFWIEVKSIDINIKSDGGCTITSSNNKLIYEVVDQIKQIEKLEGNEGNKIALVAISVWYTEGQEPKEEDFDVAPKKIADKLEKHFIDKKSNMGLLLGILDCKNYHNFYPFDSGEKVPYVILAGFILHESK